jgi:indoleamine 2,3-dioxygenase
MAPHAIIQSTPDAEADIGRMLLSKFDVTTNGFLPAKAPLSVLPDAYYESWEATIEILPTLLSRGTFRDTVDGLEVLSTNRLRSEPEWRRAYIILAFFTHAYIWGEDRAAEVKVLPMPLYEY